MLTYFSSSLLWRRQQHSRAENQTVGALQIPGLHFSQKVKTTFKWIKQLSHHTDSKPAIPLVKFWHTDRDLDLLQDSRRIMKKQLWCYLKPNYSKHIACIPQLQALSQDMEIIIQAVDGGGRKELKDPRAEVLSTRKSRQNLICKVAMQSCFSPIPLPLCALENQNSHGHGSIFVPFYLFHKKWGAVWSKRVSLSSCTALPTVANIPCFKRTNGPA